MGVAYPSISWQCVPGSRRKQAGASFAWLALLGFIVQGVVSRSLLGIEDAGARAS